jgi:hypothetical protein
MKVNTTWMRAQTATCAGPAVCLVDFQDARRFHHGRFLLAFGESFGAFSINVNAGEPLSVLIVNSDLPVAMLAPAVLVKPAGFPASLLFHDGLTLKAA